MKLPPATVTVVFITIQVGSLSVSGSVAVTHSVTLRSPVVVVRRAGWVRSMPVSSWPMVTPRPSHVGCAATNCAAPVSWVGMYGFAFGVDDDGGSTSTSSESSGAGRSSAMTSSTSSASTPATFDAASTLSIASAARTYPTSAS